MTAAANLLWECAHRPLYTIWEIGTTREIVFAALYGTGGDILIALSAVTLALLVAGDSAWPTVGYGRIVVIAILIGLSYARFSEWLNVEIRKAWAYRAAMPVLPLLDIGLSPLLQWLVIPDAACWWLRTSRSPM